MADRTPGDDIDILVRLRRANLPALVGGITLGMDALTRKAIRLQLVQIEPGTYALAIEANQITACSTPEPVNMEQIFDPLLDLAAEGE